MARLTNKQVALLARVERTGVAGLDDLRGIYSSQSGTVNALEALEARGLIRSHGDWGSVYIEGCYWTAGELSAAQRVETAERMRRNAAMAADHGSRASLSASNLDAPLSS